MHAHALRVKWLYAGAMSPAAPTSTSSQTSTSSDELVAEWRSLAGRYARVNEALERDLQRGHSLGRTEFELLARLDEGAGHKGRVTDLACEIGLSQSALSRLVDRLQAQGLVERACCTEDRRGVYVSLTGKGGERLAAARPTYAEVLERLLAD